MVKEHDTTKKAPAKKAAKPVAAKPAAAKKPIAPKKPHAVKKSAEVAHEAAAPTEHVAHAKSVKPTMPTGKYVFATGRRKTAVATVRVFSGTGEHVVNKKPFATYFFHHSYRDHALKPFQLTGLANDFHFTATVRGGGMNAQAHALQHGLARALSEINPEVRTVLKSNGLMTRDDRKKERKKPGLKRARRSPQWAKR